MNTNEQRVREFAYQIWESEGRPEGHSLRHWEMAFKLANTQPDNGSETPPSEPVEPISPGEPAHPSGPTEPIQPAEPSNQPIAPQAVTPPRKTRAAVARSTPKSLIDTQPLTVVNEKTDAPKKSGRPKKPKLNENITA